MRDYYLFMILIILFGVTTALTGYSIGSKTKDQCTLVAAYVPINGKWLEKQICLESLK